MHQSRTETDDKRVLTIKATSRTLVLTMRNFIKASVLLRQVCIKTGIRGLSTGNPVGIYLLKVNNRNTRTRCEICLNLTITLL